MHTVEFTSCLTAGWKYVDILLHFLLLPSHVIKIEVPMKIRLINKWGHSTSLTTWRQSSVCDKHSIKLPWWRICKWSFWWWSSAEHVCWTDAKRKKKKTTSPICQGRTRSLWAFCRLLPMQRVSSRKAHRPVRTILSLLLAGIMSVGNTPPHLS